MYPKGKWVNGLKKGIWKYAIDEDQFDINYDIQPATNPSEKEWLKSSDVRKMLGISHGTLQNLRIKGG